MRALCILIIVHSILNFSYSQEFMRELPSIKMRELLTPATFKNMDAVIVLKEQSFLINDTEVLYRGIELKGPSITRTKILIVKLFNEAAVQRYGSFEFNYREDFGDEIPHRFEANVRILKEDGEVWIMPKEEVKRIVSRKAKDGSPLVRKVLFKVPNLTAGDILQVEYQFQEVFSRTTSGIFFYNDRDFILFSNLYITLPWRDEAKYLSFPEEKVGAPQIKQIVKDYGAGKTYVWTLESLNPIPDEPYSLPFADQSLMTAFIVEKKGVDATGNWKSITKNFYKNYLKKDKISKQHQEALGFSKDEAASLITFDKVDQLYMAIRKKFVLQDVNSLYPLSDDIDSIFETGKGDASDLAYIMFKILEHWDQNVNIVWIRDQREGIYERKVPSTLWFDRSGVLVTIDGQERLYDFDRCIPCTYVHPWFLRSNEVVVLDKDDCFHKKVHIPTTINDNTSWEMHTLKFDCTSELTDEILFTYKGMSAEKFRGKYYDTAEDDIKKTIEKQIIGSCLSKVDSVTLNNFWDEAEVKLHLGGVCNSKAELIENFLTFKLKNTILDDFKNYIFSPVRHSNVHFEIAFQINMTWEINIPDSYTLNTRPVNQKFALEGGEESVISDVNYSLDQNFLKISASLKFYQKYIPITLFGKLITLIDNTLKEVNKDIVLKKM